MSDALFEEIRGLEDYQAARQEELKRLEEELSALERASARFTRQVEQDNGNAEARRELEETDTAVAELKKKIANHTRWTRTRVQNLRTRILQSQEQALKDLHGAMEAKHGEIAELRTAKIPAAEQALSDLREAARELEEDVADLQKRVARINKLNLDALYQE